MGQNTTSPGPSPRSHPLAAPYQTLSVLSQLPGHPTLMEKITNAPIPKQTQNFPIGHKVECYTLQTRYTPQKRKKMLAMYEWRRSALPWLVQVVDHSMVREDHACTQEEYRVVVYTEHVEKRLAHFARSRESDRTVDEGVQGVPSLTLNEGIYVLINALQAYQLLCQQWQVHYPTALSIGINQKAQVKAWINQNWASNEEASRPVEECLVIEELITVIEERMQGTFHNILSTKYNYMAYSFASIQNVLAAHTLEYQQGLQTLLKKLSHPEGKRHSPNKQKSGSKKRQTAKLSLEKTKTIEQQRRRVSSFGEKTQPRTNVTLPQYNNERRRVVNFVNGGGGTAPNQGVVFNYQVTPQHVQPQPRPTTPVHRPQVQFSVHPLAKTLPVRTTTEMPPQQIDRLIRMKTDLGPSPYQSKPVVVGRGSHKQPAPQTISQSRPSTQRSRATTEIMRQREPSISYPQPIVKERQLEQRQMSHKKTEEPKKTEEDGETSLNSMTEEFKQLLKSEKQIEKDEQERVDGLEVQEFLELLYSENKLEESEEKESQSEPRDQKGIERISEESEHSCSFEAEQAS